MALSVRLLMITAALAAWADASVGDMAEMRIADTGDWNETEVISALHGAARILMQCRIRIAHAEPLQPGVN